MGGEGLDGWGPKEGSMYIKNNRKKSIIKLFFTEMSIDENMQSRNQVSKTSNFQSAMDKN